MNHKGHLALSWLLAPAALLTVSLLQFYPSASKNAPVPEKPKAAPRHAGIKLPPFPPQALAKTAENSQPSVAKVSPATTTERRELENRAAQVEQEANHDLRRLVKLLDLTEEQQDRVFQKLAERSPAWSPAMRAASTDGTPLTVGGSNQASPELNAAAGGAYTKKPAESSTMPTTAAAAATEAVVDPMAEILALLDPVQQDALLKEESDRAAWWAEILPQITPPDEVVPALDGSTVPAAGDTEAYEGADVLE